MVNANNAINAGNANSEEAARSVLILGLGIGANTAIFSLIEGILLKPLPYPNAERLVRILQPLA
jgi:hypothetical protein